MQLNQQKKPSKLKNASLAATAVAIGAGGGFAFGDRSNRNIDTLCPAPKQFVECMITKTPYDFAVIEAYRAQTRQNKLYAKGRTEPGTIVTWTRNSRHTSGKAFDILAYPSVGEHSWNAKYYAEINEEAAKPCSIELDIDYLWGGEFKNSKGQPLGDWGHFETLECVVEKQKVDI